MRVLWASLGIIGIAALLTSCGKSEEAPHYKTPVEKPCIVPTGLPKNAMGNLGIQIIQIGKNIRIVIPSDGVFKDRTDEIKPSAYPALNDLADFLARYPNHRMIVTGYTDELGTYHRDQVLSQHQAEALITYFWTRGVPHQCLTPIGIGKDESQTVASNRSIDGKAYNRRIEINFRA